MSKTVLLIDSATKLIVAETNPPGDLTTIEEMQGQGFTVHAADHSWVCRVLVPPASGLTITNPDGFAGDPTFAFTGDLAGLLGLTGTGIAVRATPTGSWVTRSLTGTANQVIITDPDGVTGNPTFSLPQDIGTGSTMTLAGLNVGTLNATAVNASTLHLTGASGIQKAVGGTFTNASSGIDYAPATFTGATAKILKNDLAGGFTAATANTDYLPATSGSAIQKANGSGGLTGATPNTDYLPATTGSALQKANGSGGLTGAVSGTDYAPATFTGATSSILKNNLSGGFTAATANVDYLPGTTGTAIQKAASGGLTGAVANTDYLPAVGAVIPNVIGAEQITATKDRDFATAGPNWTGTNWVRPATGTITTVAVNSGAKTFTRSGGDFVADGFQVGMTVVWAGFANGGNNGSFVITTLTPTVMTCSAAAGLVTESAGASVTAVSNVWAHTTTGANGTNLPSANLTTAPATSVVYQLTYDVITGVTGVITPSIGGGNGQALGTSIGTVTANTELITSAGTADLTFTPDTTWAGWIDNVSLKIVTPAVLGNERQSFASSGMTIASSGIVTSATAKFVWTNAMVAAIGASTTGTIRVCTLPARTVIKNAYMVLDSSATAAGTLTGSVGIVGATYIDILVASDLKAAANTVYGAVSGDRGTNLTGYKFNSVTGPTNVYMYFASGSGNLSAITTCSGTLYLETVTLP